MDYRELVQQLTPEQKEWLTRKSDIRGLGSLSLHWGAILLIGWLIHERVPLWPFLLLVQGTLIVFLFTLLHETTHRTAFATRVINDVAGSVCSLLLLLPKEWFRYFHFAHHRYTQDLEKDPELATKKPETLWQYIKHISGLPTWAGHITTLVRNARGNCTDDFIPESRRQWIQTESRFMLLVYFTLLLVSAFFGTLELLYLWILPAILGQPFLRLYLLTEHARCAYAKNVFENTRTTYTHRLIRQLAWNMPYHAEHHAFPIVPFFRLGDFHTFTQDHLIETQKGYFKFNKDFMRKILR